MSGAHLKISARPPRTFAWTLALLLAAAAMLLMESSAQAASKDRGAVLVKDIAPGNPKRASTSGSPSELTNVAGTLYFAAQDRKHGFELWRSDGTRRGTRMVKDIRPGRTHTQLGSLTAVGRTLYFVADDGNHGPSLWRSDGTARGTRMVKDIVPGAVHVGAGGTNIGSLTDVAGTLFFVVGADVNSQLWRSDGTEAGTSMLEEVPMAYVDLTAVGRTLYFSGSTGLWRSDGTASGTVLVKKLGAPFYLTNVAGALFFTDSDGTRYGIWRSDGTEAGTTLVKEGVAYDLTAAGRTLYFTSGGISSLLWRSDGTETGTIPITSVGVRPEGDGFYPQLTDVGGALYFVRNDASGTLLHTDGTPSGTIELHRNLAPGSLTAVGHTLYFVGTDKKHGHELWRSDGTRKGTRLVRDIRRPRGRSSRPSDLTAVGKTLFFSARDDRHGTELWKAGAKP